jgi:hypothetical protein
MSYKKSEKNGEMPRRKLARKTFNSKGVSMKCRHLVACRNISSCSAIERPYVPSLFEFEEYCSTIDHRKCPFYLRGVICMNQAENSRMRASLE